MLAFRKKTRSNEVIDPGQFQPGLVVWVPGANGREEHVCIGPGVAPLPRKDYLSRKASQAAARNAANRGRHHRMHASLSLRSYHASL